MCRLEQLWLVGGGKVEGKAAAIVKMQPTSHSYTLKLQKQQNRIIYFYDDKNLFPSYAENARIMHFVCRDTVHYNKMYSCNCRLRYVGASGTGT